MDRGGGQGQKQKKKNKGGDEEAIGVEECRLRTHGHALGEHVDGRLGHVVGQDVGELRWCVKAKLG